MDIDEDMDAVFKKCNPSNTNKKETTSKKPAPPSSIKKREEKAINSGLQGDNLLVMGKKQKPADKNVVSKSHKKYHGGYDNYDAYAVSSEDDAVNQRSERILNRDPISNTKRQQMANEFINTKSPCSYKNRKKGKKQINNLESCSVFTEFSGRTAKRIRSMRQIAKTTKDFSGWICTVEWLQKEGEHLEPSRFRYEDCRQHIPKLVCEYFIERTTLIPYDAERAKDFE